MLKIPVFLAVPKNRDDEYEVAFEVILQKLPQIPATSEFSRKSLGRNDEKKGGGHKVIKGAKGSGHFARLWLASVRMTGADAL